MVSSLFLLLRTKQVSSLQVIREYTFENRLYRKPSLSATLNKKELIYCTYEKTFQISDVLYTKRSSYIIIPTRKRVRIPTHENRAHNNLKIYVKNVYYEGYIGIF